MRVRAFALASIAVVGIGFMGVAAPAQAAEKPAKVHKARHCVTDLSTSKPTTACYDSFTVAIAKATNGRITDAPNDVKAAMNDARLQARLKATTSKKHGVVTRALARGPIGIFYDDPNYRANSHIYNGTHDCDDAIDTPEFWVAYVGDANNDEYESFRSYRDCAAKVYQDRDFRGASLPYAYYRSDLGILNDEVSSIQWS